MEQYTSFGLSFESAAYPKPRRSIVPGRKFSSRTSLFATSFRRMSWPSAALRLRVRLFLLRLTDMKYVASPPTKGGQLRVSSPRPGSSILITSAPMSPSIIEQNGPASTRVRSRTRIPASGGVEAPSRSLAGFMPDLPQRALGPAPRDRLDALAAVTGATPEDPRAVERAQVREVVDVVDG